MVCEIEPVGQIVTTYRIVPFLNIREFENRISLPNRVSLITDAPCFSNYHGQILHHVLLKRQQCIHRLFGISLKGEKVHILSSGGDKSSNDHHDSKGIWKVSQTVVCGNG